MNQNINTQKLDQIQKKLSWSYAPIKTFIRHKLLHKPRIKLQSIADKSWEISPPEMRLVKPAYFLSNQLERITNAVYTLDPCKDMIGGFEEMQIAARGFLIKNAYLIDGSIYKDSAHLWLTPRKSKLVKLRLENEISRAAVYSTTDGNKYFGVWLKQDCTSYSLAKEEGVVITTNQKPMIHVPDYEYLLQMNPTRLNSAFMHEAVIFDDYSLSTNKRNRFREINSKLLKHFNNDSHPGVFILRRDSGINRTLVNELEIAEHLRKSRGFKIVDVTKDTVSTILEACSGSQVIIGIEGSHLSHGVMVLETGKAILALQPPDRFSGVVKRFTDRDDQHYGFVVGRQEENGYRADIDEIERTIDLFPKSVFS